MQKLVTLMSLEIEKASMFIIHFVKVEVGLSRDVFKKYWDFDGERCHAGKLKSHDKTYPFLFTCKNPSP